MTQTVTDAPTVSRIRDSLRNEYRRRIIRHLEAAQPPTEVSSLATAVAQQTADTDRSQPFTDRRNAVQTELRHMHLPKRDELDVIEYGQHKRQVKAGPLFDEARSILTDLS